MTTLISGGFTRDSTADEVASGIDLTGRRAVVTGAASGIGIETARALARRGAAVTIAARRVEDAVRAAEDICADTANPLVQVAELELTDLRSIARFADAWRGPLDILVNNAGVMLIQTLARTDASMETQFATNYFGHFALTVRLRRALAAAEDGARVVMVSSSGHLFSPVVFDDLDFRFRPYDPLAAYAQSKTAGVLFAVEATRRWRSDGITVNAVNPGAIATALQRHVGGRLATPPERQKDVRQGAATSVFVATSPLLDQVGGRYFDDSAEARTVFERPADPDELAGVVAAYALDPDGAARLWDLSDRRLSAISGR